MAKRETAFPLAKWASLDEAFVRARAALGSSDLALLDLRGHLLSGRLPSALRWFERDGTEGFEKLKATFWTVPTLQEDYEIEPDDSPKFTGRVRVRGLAAARITAPDKASLWFFVSRRYLDKLYAVAALTDDARAPVQSKPGQKYTDDHPPAQKPRKLLHPSTLKPGGGRDPRFKPEQRAALQREYRRYKKNNPGKFKYEMLEHLQLRAKDKYRIEASPGTISMHIMKPVDAADAEK